ncbi:helix-turn-helix domain-containing protein, partial [Staphylococcus aureus]|uniref:MarR family winged helix-turn-helix transcriptional regulator n=1 Tax=Staphylococcus aureus TaxID=1280 RepID=UPI00301D7E31
DRNFRQFLHNLFAFSSRLEAIRSEFGKQLGLTGIEYTCLIATAYLCENDNVYVNRLADHLHLSGAFITSQTNKLAKKGFLTKKKDSMDARRVQLEIT